MVKKLFVYFAIVFNSIFLYYLLLPVPQSPDLPNSYKSDLPGDTVQLKNVSAYYTNQTRSEVMNHYKSTYGGYFRFQLNHPPEKSKEIIRDTIQSYYLEELVIPFKESLFINGFEWENDVFTKPDKRQQNKLIFQDKEFKSKITVKSFPTNPIIRVINFLLIQAGVIVIFLSYKKSRTL